MNLLLHGLDAPQIDPGNALRFKLSEIGEKDRVDVILTNPPFGGEEEKGIQGNFPEDRQTSETALCSFCSSSCASCTGNPTLTGRPARPQSSSRWDAFRRVASAHELRKNYSRNSTSHDRYGCRTACSRLTRQFRQTLLFFDRSRPTQEVWYYEQPLPEGRKNYTKTQPIQYENFQNACLVEQSERKRSRLENIHRRAYRGWLRSGSQKSH